MITAQTLIARADQIDRRLGPISGRDADAIAVELREAARLIAAELDLAKEGEALLYLLDISTEASGLASIRMKADQVRRFRDAIAKATGGQP